MTKLAIAPVTRADLQDIRRYSKAAFGPRVAASYLTGLRDRFEVILRQPVLGRQETDLGVGIRSVSYRSHRIYYQHRSDDFVIVRILHHARHAKRAFPVSA